MQVDGYSGEKGNDRRMKWRVYLCAVRILGTYQRVRRKVDWKIFGSNQFSALNFSNLFYISSSWNKASRNHEGVWKCYLNLWSINVLFLLCLIWFSSDWMGIWNKDFVGPCIQAPRSSSKILRSVSYFRVISVFRSWVRWNTISSVSSMYISQLNVATREMGDLSN